MQAPFNHFLTKLEQILQYAGQPILNEVFHGVNSAMNEINHTYQAIVSCSNNYNIVNKYGGKKGVILAFKSDLNQKYSFIVGLDVSWISQYGTENEIILYNQILPISCHDVNLRERKKRMDSMVNKIINMSDSLLNNLLFLDEYDIKNLSKQELVILLHHEHIRAVTKYKNLKVYERLIIEFQMYEFVGLDLNISRECLNSFDQYNLQSIPNIRHDNSNIDITGILSKQPLKYKIQLEYKDITDKKTKTEDVLISLNLNDKLTMNLDGSYTTKDIIRYSILIELKDTESDQKEDYFVSIFKDIPKKDVIITEELKLNNEIYQCQSLILKSNGKLLVSKWDNESNKGGTVKINCDYDIILENGSELNGFKCGYFGEFGPGHGNKSEYSEYSGASYGTKGGDMFDIPSGNIYGDKYISKLYMGSGMNSDDNSHKYRGGGAIQLISNKGNIHNNGTITCDGDIGSSGGSIFIISNKFTNDVNGLISVKGGNGNEGWNYGNGGFGRIAIYADTYINNGNITPNDTYTDNKIKGCHILDQR